MFHVALPNKEYNYPEIKNIINSRKSSLCKELFFDDKNNLFTAKKDNLNIVFGLEPSEKMCKKLYENGESSEFGKGKETLLDEKIRKSIEYKNFNIDESFFKIVKKSVTDMLEEMNAGELIEIKPHKIIIYSENDFFKNHIDTCHIESQTMSCVVELPTNWSSYDKNGFEIDNVNYPSNGKTKIFVFDHDLLHQVPCIQYGYRISITFDLVVKQKELFGDVDFKSVVEHMKSLNVRRCGFFANHDYFVDENNISQKLKGLDYVLLEKFKPFATKIEQISLYNFDRTDWYLKKVFDIINLRECQLQIVNCRNLEIEHVEWCSKLLETEKNEIPDKNYYRQGEENSWYSIIKEEYYLGDILRLQTKSNHKLEYVGDEDSYLGNEACDASLHKNIFFVINL